MPNVAPLSVPGAAGGTPNYGPWYTASLGGQVLPGKWRCTAGGIRIKFDPKKKPGVDGGNPVFHGMQPMAFELEGEQFTDDERNALVDVLAQVLPQPGASQDADPISLQHPALSAFRYTINVKVMGCSIFEHTGPAVTKMRISLQHWMPPKPNAVSATKQPTTSTRNLRAAAARKQNPPNPLPTTQPGIAGPPLNYTPGSGS